MLLMKLDHHDQRMSLGIMYQKNATSKPCPKKIQWDKNRGRRKKMYEFIISIFRIQHDNKTQGMIIQ